MMGVEDLARVLWDIDQRIAFGHVKTPWSAAAGKPRARTMKRAEQLLLERAKRDRAAAARAIVDALGGRWLVLLKPRDDTDPPAVAYDDMAEDAQAFWRAVADATLTPGDSGSTDG